MSAFPNKMPYKVKKKSCKQSSGKSGSYILSYKDKKGKSHSACHTSKKKAQGQISAIEMNESDLRLLIRDILIETTYSIRSTYFRNPYEDPGEEFEIDPEDPIGLVRQARMKKIKDEMRDDGRD